jgi:7-carboxy-7-deazaguanine synthase
MMDSGMLLAEGKVLPLMESFGTLQGEGFNTGKPAWFIRIGGCDVGCDWCDVKESWNAALFPPVPTDQIIREALGSGARAVVVTGGEPLNYNLDYLCKGLKEKGVQLFIETAGSQPLSGTWDWICLSPKKEWPPLEEFFRAANELKMIIHEKEDIQWAEENAGKVHAGCLLYMQPEWSQKDHILPEIVDYIYRNPKWRLSLQAHKYIGIP